jgi:formylglycine-generating enzyme required for sulfatase activity
MRFFSSIYLSLILTLVATVSAGKDVPKIAVWDLTAGNINPSYAQDLTSILVSEISKLEKYEVYSQENVRTLAGWTAERMTLGCTDTKCLTALGQMDIAKLISGRVGKIGNRYSVSLNLFDTQNARAEKSVSEVGRSEDELIDLVQVAVRKLLGEEVIPSKIEQKLHEKATTVVALPKLEKSFKDPLTGMEFVLVKSGCFEMGDTFGAGNPWEKPVHEVCLKDFYLGKNEVTQGQWKRVMGGNPSNFKESDENPVEMVSWNDVQEFIRRLNQMSGRSYRLPTEAEWEFAARSGGKKEEWAGTSNESELQEYAWFQENSAQRTHPVGRKKPNGLGFYDMSGNVWEWVNDWYDSEYYRNTPQNEPQGPIGGQYKVLRGGSWNSSPWRVRAADRNRYEPSLRHGILGFRLGLSP